jgi:hypothetical protein
VTGSTQAQAVCGWWAWLSGRRGGKVAIRVAEEGGKMWKKFKVYDGNDESEWEKANQFYESIRGKRILGKSMPTKVDGFYHCSTQEIGLQMATSFNALSNEKWSNRFQLKKDILSYARVFVGYENLEYDPPEYTIFIKFVELVDTPSTRAFLKKYHSKKETVQI